MIGALIILGVLLVALPVAIMFLGVALSVIASWSLTRNGEESHPGSELIDLHV